MRHQRIFGVATPLLFGAALLAGGSSTALAACGLQSADNRIKHVVHIQFRQTCILRRDNPNVPSDPRADAQPASISCRTMGTVERQSPHTADLAHRNRHPYRAHGRLRRTAWVVPVSNSYGLFFAMMAPSEFSSSFLYWTALSGDGKPLLINENGKTFPAPWVPFTRAGCDVGAFSIANMEFESLPADVRTVFGTDSPEDVSVSAALALSRTTRERAPRARRRTPTISVSRLHCAQGSPLCNNSHGPRRCAAG